MANRDMTFDTGIAITQNVCESIHEPGILYSNKQENFHEMIYVDFLNDVA